ncbi:hypothetical protein GGF32_003819 [Allomyces javanicus]|nr:hypothetical protein GGF32_003819 [Allomyces javanicus]
MASAKPYQARKATKKALELFQEHIPNGSGWSQLPAPHGLRENPALYSAAELTYLHGNYTTIKQARIAPIIRRCKAAAGTLVEVGSSSAIELTLCNAANIQAVAETSPALSDNVLEHQRQVEETLAPVEEAERALPAFDETATTDALQPMAQSADSAVASQDHVVETERALPAFDETRGCDLAYRVEWCLNRASSSGGKIKLQRLRESPALYSAAELTYLHGNYTTVKQARIAPLIRKCKAAAGTLVEVGSSSAIELTLRNAANIQALAETSPALSDNVLEHQRQVEETLAPVEEAERALPAFDETATTDALQPTAQSADSAETTMASQDEVVETERALPAFDETRGCDLAYRVEWCLNRASSSGGKIKLQRLRESPALYSAAELTYLHGNYTTVKQARIAPIVRRCKAAAGTLVEVGSSSAIELTLRNAANIQALAETSPALSDNVLEHQRQVEETLAPVVGVQPPPRAITEGTPNSTTLYVEASADPRKALVEGGHVTEDEIKALHGLYFYKQPGTLDVKFGVHRAGNGNRRDSAYRTENPGLERYCSMYHEDFATIYAAEQELCRNVRERSIKAYKRSREWIPFEAAPEFVQRARELVQPRFIVMSSYTPRTVSDGLSEEQFDNVQRELEAQRLRIQVNEQESASDLKRRQQEAKTKAIESKIQIVLHSRPWCGHCQRLHQVGSYQSAKTVAEQQSNGQIRFDENTNASPDEMARYGIKGFPTIVAVNTATKELVDTFTGDRNDPKAIVTHIEYPDASDFIIPLPSVLSNVTRIRFIANVFPNVDQAINPGNNTLRWINKEDLDLGYPEYKVTITSGSYRTLANLQAQIELQVNSVQCKRRAGTGVPHYFIIPTNGIQTVRGYGIVTVTQPNHGYIDGETIEIIGIRGSVGGIPSSVLNGRFQISLRGPDQFSYEVASIATATEEGGGAVIKSGREVDWQLIGQYDNTILGPLGFRVENSSVTFPANSVLMSRTQPITGIQQSGRFLHIICPNHGLRVQDTVYLHEFYVSPTVYDNVRRGIFTVANVLTPDVFAVEYTVDSVTSIKFAFVGTQVIHVSFPNHGLNRIVDIQQVTPGTIEVTMLLPHKLAAGDTVCVSQSNSTPSIDGKYTIQNVQDDTFQIRFDQTLTSSGFNGILCGDLNIVMYGVPAFGGFREADLNGVYLTVRDILNADEFTYTVRTGFARQTETIDVSGKSRLNSKVHGWSGSKTNYDPDTMSLYRPVNLSGDSYSYLTCPNLPQSDDFILTTAPGTIKNVIGVLLLNASPGYTLFNNAVDTSVSFTKPIQTLSELHFRHVGPGGTPLNFGGLDWMMVLEITELVHTLDNVNVISKPLV